MLNMFNFFVMFRESASKWEMFYMVYMLEATLDRDSTWKFPLRIEHIEHIEHFPCFKHMFLNMAQEDWTYWAFPMS